MSVPFSVRTVTDPGDEVSRKRRVSPQPLPFSPPTGLYGMRFTLLQPLGQADQCLAGPAGVDLVDENVLPKSPPGC